MLFLVPIREMARIQSKPLVRHGSLVGTCLRQWRRDGSTGSEELLATTRNGDSDWGWRCRREAPMPGQEVLTATRVEDEEIK
ncbi:unnamed protein product [Linum trigynum]|uniref:Uncharacterized protein n=1 Tax=Linum trigynum TaxID=586398 RepID=A0AAV2DS78_9ROSI